MAVEKINCIMSIYINDSWKSCLWLSLPIPDNKLIWKKTPNQHLKWSNISVDVTKLILNGWDCTCIDSLECGHTEYTGVSWPSNVYCICPVVASHTCNSCHKNWECAFQFSQCFNKSAYCLALTLIVLSSPHVIIDKLLVGWEKAMSLTPPTCASIYNNKKLDTSTLMLINEQLLTYLHLRPQFSIQTKSICLDNMLWKSNSYKRL